MDEFLICVDDGLVVGGDAAEDAGLNHALHQLDVVASTSAFEGKAMVRAFLVGAFAEANANSLPQQALGVARGAEEIGLEDRTDGSGERSCRCSVMAMVASV